jgi:hypothetical protein
MAFGRYSQPHLGEGGSVDTVADFEIYIDDERYTVPTLHLIAAPDHARAIEMANHLLEESAHHRGVEVRSGEAVLFVAGSLAKPAG